MRRIFRSSGAWLGMALALAATGVGTGRAQELVRPTAVTASTAATDFYPAVNLINQSGLSGSPTAANHSTIVHAAASVSTAWVTASSGTDWYAAPKPPPILTFALGGDFTLSGMVVWGYPTGTNANNNEAKVMGVEFSTDDGATWSEVVTLTHGRTGKGSQALDFGASHVANAVRVTITDNHFATAGAVGGDRVGLGEVRFLGQRIVPPSPVLEVNPGFVDFGSGSVDPAPVARTLSVKNAGPSLALHLASATVDGRDASRFQINGFPGSVAAGEVGIIDLAFDAAGVAGCYYAWLRLVSDDPARPSVTVGLVAAVGCVPVPAVAPGFSRSPGTFADAFSLALTPSTPGATIVYTTDGSAPDLAHGRSYSSPIAISQSTHVRAASILPGQDPAVASAGYIKLSSALLSKTSPLPILVVENFGAGAIPDKGWTTDHQTGAGLRQRPRQPAMMSLHDRDPATGRAALLGSSSLEARAGIRVRGAYSSTWTPKPYSIETWDEADADRALAPLGMPKGSDWVLYHPHPSYDETMIFNTFIWELSRQTGRYAPRFRFVELYVNEGGGELVAADRRGLYALVEEVNLDSNRIDVDPLSEDGATGGWLHTINRMDPEPEEGFPAPNGAMAPQFFHTPGPNRIPDTVANGPQRLDDLPKQYNAYINFEDPGGYRINPAQRTAVEGWFREFEGVLYDAAKWRDPLTGYRHYLDTRDFIDYFQLLNLARQGDGLLLSMFPWVSSGVRKLHMGPMWDFNNGAYHLSGAPNATLYFRQTELWYPRLFADPAFLDEYVDRWFELRRGPYGNANLRAIADQQAAAITTEMANAQGVSTSSWTARLTAMKNFLVQRADWIDSQYFRPPLIVPAPGVRAAAFDLTLSNPGPTAGTVYFTTDGSDPRAPDGTARGVAYATPVPVSSSTVIRARTLGSNGKWSALNAGTFIVGQPAEAATLVVSEIHYHPAGPGDAGEFIELMNISATHTIDLTGVRIDRGVDVVIPVGESLAPGERAIVARHRTDFAAPGGPRVLGEFTGDTRLDNGGEVVRVLAWDGAVIAEFAWDDVAPWPVTPDGQGPSLTLIDPGDGPDPANPLHWRPSAITGGTPGFSDAVAFSGDPLADDDGDGIPNLAAHALGLTLPGLVRSLPVLQWQSGQLTWQIPISLVADDVVVTTEWSRDLRTWQVADGWLPLQARLESDLTRWHYIFASPPPVDTPVMALRVRVTLRP